MGKYDHLISYSPRPERPGEVVNKDILRKIAWTEESIIPGAPYFEIMWFCSEREPGPATHTHDFDEIVGFVGGDPENPEELNATVKFFLGDEWYTFTKSVIIFIPAGMDHSPMEFSSIKRPFIHFSGGSAGKYIKSE